MYKYKLARGTGKIPNACYWREAGKFACLSFSKDIAEVFLSFCKAALQSELQTSCSTDVFTYNGSNGYVVTRNVQSITYQKIRETGIPFHGANLFISAVPEVRCDINIPQILHIALAGSEHRCCHKDCVHQQAAQHSPGGTTDLFQHLLCLFNRTDKCD